MGLAPGGGTRRSSTFKDVEYFQEPLVIIKFAALVLQNLQSVLSII